MADTDQPPADARLDWIVRVLGVQITSSPAGGKAATGDMVSLQKSRLAWDGTRKSILTQLKAIESAIIADVTKHNEDPETEDEYDLSELTGNMPRLYGMLERYDERLIDKLDQALNAEGERRAGFHAEASAIVKEYQAALAADEELTRIDASGFSAPLRPVIQKTLSVLGQML